MAAKNLVIVESPAKAKTLEKYLGRDFQVKASVGHIVDLPKSKLGVDIKKNFAPDFHVIQSKKKVIDDLKKAAKSAESEANLRGHLKRDGKGDNGQEEGGSASYVAQEKAKDTQLNYGLDLLRGIRSVGTDAKKKAEAN